MITAPQKYSVLTCLLTSFCFGCSAQSEVLSFDTSIRPFIDTYCVTCHGGDKVKGKVDFVKIGHADQLDAQFEVWAKVVELLQDLEMPPEDELQPTEAEREMVSSWYQQRFVHSVEARPGTFRARRLSVVEYRNTMRTLFGFDLESSVAAAEQTQTERSLVMSLLPTDPPGRSGFTNDTHGNPLSTEVWDQYSFLADVALAELFSPHRRAELEVYAGPVTETVYSDLQVERLIQQFATRAWRRSPVQGKLEPMIERVLASEDRVVELKAQMKAVLMSPAFMYRGMLTEHSGTGQRAVDDFELAERLSYFIWGDMPDDELLKLAASGQLREPAVFRSQIDRLLSAPGVRNLSENFAVEWLALDEIDRARLKIPQRQALKSQPIDFMHYLFTENRRLTELIDSRVAFANPFTAHHYGADRKQMVRYQKPKGIEVEAVPNQRIQLKETKERGGILTMPGIAAMNHGPVIRGTWILERIFGEDLPDPPMDVGSVPPNKKGEQLSFRERFERHRSEATCAVCHDKIDPLGFAMQRYNAAGGYIPLKLVSGKKKAGGPAEELDTSGQLSGGERFADMRELKKILVTSQRPVIVRNQVERMLSYALCRKLEIYDQPVLEEITEKMIRTNGSYRDLVQEIAVSLPFQEALFSDGE